MAQSLAANQNPFVLPTHYPIPLALRSRSECNVMGCGMDLRHRNASQDHAADIDIIHNHMQWHVQQQQLQFVLPVIWRCQSNDSGDDWCRGRVMHGLTAAAKIRHYEEHQARRNESSGVPAIFRIGARDRRKLKGKKAIIPSVFVGYLRYERFLPQRDRHIVRASIDVHGNLSFKIHFSNDNSRREGLLGAVDPALPGPAGQPAPVPPLSFKVAEPLHGEIEFLDAFKDQPALGVPAHYQGDQRTYSDIERLCRKEVAGNYCDQDGGVGLISELLPLFARRQELIEAMRLDPRSTAANVLIGQGLSNRLAQFIAGLNPVLRHYQPNGNSCEEWRALHTVYMLDQLD